MNILLNNVCNQKCSYCFAKEVLSESAESISEENFEYYLKFLKLNNFSFIRMLGGEPTLHKNFVEFLNRCHEEKFKVTVFTNGLMSSDIISRLKLLSNNNIFIINLNDKKTYSEDKWNSINDNIKSLIEMGNEVSISLNVYKEKFDYSYLREVFEKHPSVKMLRIGICNPMVGQKGKKLVNYDNFKAIGKEIVAMIDDLHRNYRVFPSLDCGIPICMFDGNDFKKITAYSISKKEYSCFDRSQGDIDSSLDLFNCFPFAKENKVSLREFNSILEIEKWMNFDFKFYKEHRHEMCIDCDFDKSCSGLCIAHIFNEELRTKKKNDKYIEIVKLLFLKRYSDIDEEEAYKYLKTVDDQFLKVFLDLHLKNKYDQAWEYISSNENLIKSKLNSNPEYWRFVVDFILISDDEKLNSKIEKIFPYEYSEAIRIRSIRNRLNGVLSETIFDFEKEKFVFSKDEQELKIGTVGNFFVITNSELIDFFKELAGKALSKREIIYEYESRGSAPNIDQVYQILENIEKHFILKTYLR